MPELTRPNVYVSWYGKFYHSTRSCSVLYRAKESNISEWHPNHVKARYKPCPECVQEEGNE